MLDIIVPRIFWFPLQPWSPVTPCSLSWLWVDMRCPPLHSAHDAITSSPWHSSRDTALALQSLSVVSAGRVTWHCEPGVACDNNCDMMTEYEYTSNGKSGVLLYILEERCFYFRKTGYNLWLFNGFPRELKWSFFPNDDFLPKKEFDLLLEKI